jgi:hypothetical protein
MYRAAAIIILIISSFVINGYSQIPVTYSHDDSVTYSLYMSKSWTKLMDYNDKMTDSSQSYYTAFRIGAAYYEKSKYMPASELFEIAAMKNKADDLTAEYLYYSYLYSGRYSDARIKSSSFSPALKKKIKYKKPSFFSGFYTEGGYFVNKGYDKQKAINTAGIYNIFGEQMIIKNYYYANLSLSHLIGKRLSIFHGFSYFNYTFTRQFTEKDNKVTNLDTDSKQKDYYFSFNYNFGQGYGLNGAFHFLNISGTVVDYSLNNVNNNITYKYDTYNSNLNEFAFSFSLEKRIPYAKLLVSSSISNLNMANQFQGGLSLTIYPLGNLNLYGYLNAQYCSNVLENNINQDHFIATPGLGFKVSDYLWLEAYYTFGGIFNYTEDNAFVIYNNVNRITNKLNIKAISPVIYNKLELSLSFEYFNLKQSYFTYTNTTDFYINFNNNKNLRFIGGIKWSL